VRAQQSLIRLAIAVVVLGAGIFALWQAGIILESDTTAPVELQPASLSVPTQTPVGRQVGLREGNIAPNFEFSAFDGQRLSLSDFRGRPVFLNFWATWCTPCKAELPAMEESLRQFAGDDLAIIAVNNGEKFGPADRFLRDLGIDLTAFGYDPEASIVQRYEIIGMPTSYFIDAEGVITRVVAGALSKSLMQNSIQTAIEGHKAP
jgi:thiol-disulfide isomerase/thioredoxin